MKTNTRILGTLFMGLMLLHAASAQSILSYFAATPAVSAPSGSFTNWTKTLQLPAFDPSLGILTQVKLTYTGEALQTAKGENLSGGAAPFSYNVTTTLTLAKAMEPMLFSPAPITLAGSGTSGAFDGTIDFGGSSGFNFTQDITTSGIFTNSSAATLAQYTGLGMIDFTGTATATSSVTGSGAFVSQTISKASASLGLEYTFTPIPEPSTCALIIGLAAFGCVTFRRRKAFGN